MSQCPRYWLFSEAEMEPKHVCCLRTCMQFSTRSLDDHWMLCIEQAQMSKLTVRAAQRRRVKRRGARGRRTGRRRPARSFALVPPPTIPASSPQPPCRAPCFLLLFLLSFFYACLSSRWHAVYPFGGRGHFPTPDGWPWSRWRPRRGALQLLGIGLTKPLYQLAHPPLAGMSNVLPAAGATRLCTAAELVRS